MLKFWIMIFILFQVAESQNTTMIAENMENYAIEEYMARIRGATSFVTIHIEAENIKKSVHSVQESLLSANKAFAPYLSKLSALHVTFDIFGVNSTNIDDAKTALHEAAEVLYDSFGPLNIGFQGTFKLGKRSFVSFPDKQSTKILTQYHEKINEIFDEYGVPPLSEFTYKPHMTIAEHLNSKLMTELNDLEDSEVSIGKAYIKKLQLCTMTMKPSDPYYTVLAEAYFSSAKDHLTNTYYVFNKTTVNKDAS